MPAPRLAFWFEFASTYSYLSAMRVSEVAETHGIDVDWRPFLLGPIFAAQGWETSPFNLYPSKGRYMWRDMERICKERGLPFARPAVFPQNGLVAARVALAAGPEMPAFCKAVFQAQFGAGEDISHPDVLSRCLEVSGLPKRLLDQSQSAQIKTALREQTDEAMALGLFGAPSFTAGTELFWGDDRMEQAMAWCKSQTV